MNWLDCDAQVQELHRKLSEETRRADNLAFEMKKLEEKHETVMKEKEVRRYSHARLVLLPRLATVHVPD